ncbi:MOSC domain-containing protein [Armatimonas rosea]|uniref:MOSC domain-containing protein YiiM n=1 Tax=Armatimonas rosea TaxID=685828 RepID=A0A7W9SU55_ARMRO|nr:MOSC domain-containing protein [Armatimonas rosea]MBB6052887.1 MOSC domain-containing protein YiiM [Armatimonas rosea]
MSLTIHTQLIGQPQTRTDSKGEWRTAIYREPVVGPVALGLRGLDGDKVADTKHHGSKDQAVCVHPLAHHTHWSAVYGVVLSPGAVGENWTLIGDDETTVCIGDIYTVGTAQVQVSQPRFPCSKQERKLGLKGFLKAVMATGKSGWYLRVLTPGTVQAGDVLTLESRSEHGLTVDDANRALLGETLDTELIERLLAVPELAAVWKRGLRRRLSKTTE